ncbi:MAG: ankyrin repeat domain-containing protein [Candidatus Berkiella sp.]
MKSFLLNATTWENSCGLATIGHALTKTMLSSPLGKQSAHPTVHLLEEAFSSYYQIPNMSLSKIRDLLKYYLHPEDQQKIMIGPLKLLLNNAPRPNNQRLSTTSEITRLCKLLRISVMNDVFKGYKGNAPFCEVVAKLNGNQWQPATQSMSESFLQQKLWKEGFRHFTHHDPYELQNAVKQMLSIEHNTGQIKALQKAFVAQSYNRIAQLSKAEANSFANDHGFHAVIAQAIKTRNISALLSIYYFKPSLRNYILHKAINIASSAFVNDLLKSYYSLKQGISDTNQWNQELDKALPCIERVAADTELHTAIRKKDIQSAKKLISDGEDIYQPNDNEVSPLHLVCAREDRSFLHEMVDAEYNKQGAKGFWQNLFYAGVDLSQKDVSGSTPLHYAANGSDPGFVDILLSRHRSFFRRINFRVRDNQGRTPVHLAALNSCSGILQHFLTLKRAHIAAHNDQDDMGLTPLHYAAAAKRHDNIRLLLRAGASVTSHVKVDKLYEQFPAVKVKLNQTTPLWISLEVNDLDGAALLISSATQLWETRSSQGLNAIQLATREGRIDLLKAWDKQFHHSYLLRRADDNGKFLIHHAAIAGRVDVVKYLVTQGEWLTRPDLRWNTPLHFAAQHGHVELVRYLCDEAQKEKDHNASLARQGQVQEFLQKKRIMIQIDGENSFAETPHLLAQLNGHVEAAKVLARAGAKPVSLSDYLLKAIYGATGDDRAKSEYKAACIVAKLHTMALETDANLNTFLHHAVKAGNYRAVLMLIHPLKPEQRKTLVSTKNRAGQTPLELLDQIKRNSKDSQQKRTLDKIERALVRYDAAAFVNKYPSAMQEGRYREQFANDFQEELEQTSAYYYVSSASHYLPMILDGISKAASATNPFLAPFAFGFGVVESFLGGDVLDNTERSLSFFAQRNPTFYPGAVNMASNVLSGFGWYRHTTRRLTVTMAKKISARILSLSVLENYNSESKNFIDYINWLGLIHAATEEVGRKKIANSLVEYWESYESALEKVGMPKVNTMMEATAEVANTVVKDATGIDVGQSARRGYGWLRENLGSLPSTGAELLQVMDTVVMQGISIDDPAQIEAVRRVLEAGIDAHRYDNAKLLDFVCSMKAYVLTGEQSEHFVPLLSETITTLNSQTQDAGQIVASFILSTPFYQQLRASHLSLATLAERLKSDMQSIVADSNNQEARLQQMLRQGQQHAIDSYVQTLHSGQLTANNYKNIVKSSDIKYSADGISEYAAQILVFNNPMIFGGYSQEQKLAFQGYFRAFFNQMQHSGTKFDEQAVVKNFDRAKTFLLSGLYVDLILSGESVTGTVPAIFAQWDPMTVRAAVAAHEVSAMVADNPSYTPLTVDQSFTLFRQFFDQQYASSTQKVEQGMLDIVNETLRAHDQTGGHFQPIWGEHTLDSAAQFVSSSSKQIAENRWQGTNDAYARSIGNNNKGKVHRFFSSMEKDARTELKREGGSSTMGGSTNGITHSATFFHTPSGTQTALNVPFEDKRLTFTMPSTVKAEPLGKVAPSKSAPQRTPIYSLETVTDRTPIYTPLLAANDVRPSQKDTQTSEPLGKVVPKKDTQAASPVTPQEPRKTSKDAVTSLLSHGPKKAEVKLIPELPRSLLTLPTANSSVTPPPQNLSFGDRLLSFIGIGTAQANPVAIAGLAIAGATAIGAVMKPHQQDARRGSNSPDEERRLTSPSYTGLIPNRDEIEVESTSFPAVSSGGRKTETLLNQPGLTSLVLTTPYFGLKKLQNIYNRNSQQESPGVYDHDYEKHQPRAGGGGALWGPKASLNPIPSSEIGQKLLDSSYLNPDKPNQRFNYYDGKIIKFRTSNDGKWHSYEVHEKIDNEVGSKILNKFLEDKLISKSEYRKLIKK